MPDSEFECDVQIRYKSLPVRSRVKKLATGYKISFTKPQLAVTPGQSAVIYDGDECLGGSVIRERISQDFYNWATNRGYNYKVYG